MECFEPPAEPQQLLARLDVVAKHATSALHNAVRVFSVVTLCSS